MGKKTVNNLFLIMKYFWSILFLVFLKNCHLGISNNDIIHRRKDLTEKKNSDCGFTVRRLNNIWIWAISYVEERKKSKLLLTISIGWYLECVRTCSRIKLYLIFTIISWPWHYHWYFIDDNIDIQRFEVVLL